MRMLFILLASFSAAAHADMHRLDGTNFPAGEGRVPVLMFWRADCPPCLVELRHARAYAEAAGSAGRVIFVGLQDPVRLRRAAERYSAPPEMLAFADGDSAAVLDSYGVKPALPVTVMLSPSGQTCFRHAGLLGTDALEEGLKYCGGGDARH